MLRQYDDYTDKANETRTHQGSSTLEIRKVKAHRTAVQAAKDGDKHAFLANAIADAAATKGTAAYRAQAHEERINRMMLIATTTLKRVVAIELVRYRDRPEKVELPLVYPIPEVPTATEARERMRRNFFQPCRMQSLTRVQWS